MANSLHILVGMEIDDALNELSLADGTYSFGVRLLLQRRHGSEQLFYADMTEMSSEPPSPPPSTPLDDFTLPLDDDESFIPKSRRSMRSRRLTRISRASALDIFAALGESAVFTVWVKILKPNNLHQMQNNKKRKNRRQPPIPLF